MTVDKDFFMKLFDLAYMQRWNDKLRPIPFIEMDKQASIDLEASFNTINDRLIEEVIKTNWSGLSFSERIWEHRRKLAFTIKSELNKGLIRGESLQDISKIISDKFDTSFSNAMRLVRTESCWIMNEATVNNYKNNGIKEYEMPGMYLTKERQSKLVDRIYDSVVDFLTECGYIWVK